ncbi:hypothetical protein F4604DRAFT_1688433 [Suillus subluteus]|nr:hypothetical protein F4604DRAFT_1688433 [Suillus subluteus]
MRFEVYFMVVVCDDELEGSVIMGNNEMPGKVAPSPDLTLEVPDLEILPKSVLSAAAIAKVLQLKIPPLAAAAIIQRYYYLIVALPKSSLKHYVTWDSAVYAAYPNNRPFKIDSVVHATCQWLLLFETGDDAVHATCQWLLLFGTGGSSPCLLLVVPNGHPFFLLLCETGIKSLPLASGSFIMAKTFIHASSALLLQLRQ